MSCHNRTNARFPAAEAVVISLRARYDALVLALLLEEKTLLVKYRAQSLKKSVKLVVFVPDLY